MSEPTTNAPQQQTQVAVPQTDQQVQQLRAQITDLTSKLQATQKAIETITSERDTLQQRLGEATQQIETLTNEAKKQEVVFGELTKQVQELTAYRETAQTQLQLYEMVKGDPKYHGLLPMLDAVRVVSDPDQQKAILDQVAEAQQAAIQSAVKNFQAGSSLPAAPQATPNTNGGEATPKTFNEAIQMAYQALEKGDNARFDQLLDLAMQIQNGSTQQA